MKSDIKYKIFNDSLIFESCPSVLTKEMLDEICAYNYKKIVLCEGIEEIEDRAFIDYWTLENIELPISLKKIGKETFRECSELKEIILPDNIEKIDDLTFYKCVSLSKVVLPRYLKYIGNKAFEYCSIESINLSNDVSYIGNEAFCFCYDLKEINFPLNLKKIGKKAFYKCFEIKHIKLHDNVIDIGESAFEGCAFLSSINIPDSVEVIKNKTFFGCDSLKDIYFSKNLKSIGVSAFENCKSLKSIPRLEKLEVIGKDAFYNCYSLMNVELGDSVREINSRAFAYCAYLGSIVMGDSVEKLGSEAFYQCINLTNVVLSPNINVIEDNTFKICKGLKNIVIPEGVVEIKSKAFKECNLRLEKVDLPKSLRKIGKYAFADCSSLKEIVVPEGIEKLPMGVFSLCDSLESITLPSSIEIFDRRCLSYCDALNTINLNTKNGIKVFDFKNIFFVDDIDCKFMVYNRLSCKYSFYMNGKYIEFSIKDLTDKPNVLKMIKNGSIEPDYFIRLYHWNKRRFVPGHIVIRNMPLEDIEKFYVNDNGKEWSKLVSSAGNIFSDEGRESFFKLCYVLGLFSESTAIRDRAVKFLNDKIVNVIDGDYIHSKFDGFDLRNGFDEEYAEFFIKYYNDNNFMIIKDEYGDEIDLMAASYNNFKNVKKVYPGKTLHTNRKADVLLPIHVMNAVRNTIYGNVNDGNEDFAFVVGKYGYTQEQFEKLQSFYNIGKNIEDKDLKLFIEKDNVSDGITYELLSKKEPLNSVLGNITNCCQVLGAAGESCLEYGMTKANSGFIVFSYKGKIIGQSWVWYDEDSKTVCLDNIEIPHRYSDKIKDSKIIQKSFIECLIRIKENFVSEMNKNGLEVKNVTVGKGFNDIQYVLDKYFSLVEFSDMLTDYSGYSDAKEQYDIKIIKNNINQDR